MSRSTELQSRLRDDIRHPGRLLGETLRTLEGDAIFDLIEEIRSLSIRFHRDGDKSSETKLQKLLAGIDTAGTVRVARAFSFFYQLANIAEDVHLNRRYRQMRKSKAAREDGDFELALERIRAAGMAPSRWWTRSAACSPRRCSPPTRPRSSARASSTTCARSTTAWMRATWST
jgi:phosphoenolpyruvate carboxylase